MRRRLGEGQLQEDGVDGLRRSCRLLRSRAGEDALQLLQEFAPWVLRCAPEEGLKLFTLGEVSTVPIAAFVLELLQSLEEPQRSEFRAKYVRYLVVMHRVDTPAVNTEFVLERLAQLQALAEQQGVSLAVEKLEDTPAACRDLRAEILQFLETNAWYDPAAVLDAIAEKPLVFERIVVLARLRRFEEALRLVLNELRSVAKACECCRRFSQRVPEGVESPWRTLLRLLFSEEDEAYALRAGVRRRKKQAFREAAVRVLVAHGYEIDPLDVGVVGSGEA